MNPTKISQKSLVNFSGMYPTDSDFRGYIQNGFTGLLLIVIFIVRKQVKKYIKKSHEVKSPIEIPPAMRGGTRGRELMVEETVKKMTEEREKIKGETKKNV